MQIVKFPNALIELIYLYTGHMLGQVETSRGLKKPYTNQLDDKVHNDYMDWPYRVTKCNFIYSPNSDCFIMSKKQRVRNRCPKYKYSYNNMINEFQTTSVTNISVCEKCVPENQFVPEVYSRGYICRYRSYHGAPLCECDVIKVNKILNKPKDKWNKTEKLQYKIIFTPKYKIIRRLLSQLDYFDLDTIGKAQWFLDYRLQIMKNFNKQWKLIDKFTTFKKVD